MSMEKENTEISLIYQSKSEWIRSLLFGIVLGLFVIIPGVSGATLLISLGVYYKVVYAVSNILKKGKKKLCFTFLLPLVLGILIGLLSGLFLIRFLLDIVPFSTIFLFAGLMIGSSPVLFKEIKGKEKRPSNILLMLIGTIFILLICFLSIYLSREELFYGQEKSVRTLADVETYFYFVSILIGFVIGITQVIPGLSASAFLMMIGYYSIILNSIHFSIIKESPMIILIFVLLIAGFLLGVLITNKIMLVSMKKNKGKMDFLISGLAIGSILALFVSKELFEKVYLVYFSSKMSTIQLVDFIIGFLTFGIGITISLLISRKATTKEEIKEIN